MLARRIIPCLDVRDGKVVKGVRFANHEVVGDIVELAKRYAREGADELVFYDIGASPQGRRVDTKWIDAVARALDIPFCVAGGIATVEDAAAVLAAGADKISVNSPALRNPGLINALSARFGRQCVVVGIDSFWDGADWRVHALTGDAATSHDTGRKTADWVAEVQQRGAGEIVLNCMNEDGRRQGYDVRQLGAMRARCTVPLIASGGAGCAEDFITVFKKTQVDGALAASVFHKRVLAIPALKTALRTAGVEVRP